MRNPKKLNKFYTFSVGVFLLLALLRWTVVKPQLGASDMKSTRLDSVGVKPAPLADEVVSQPLATDDGKRDFVPHRVVGVRSYAECFPDAQDVQIVAARANGVGPFADREEAMQHKGELAYIGCSPYYHVDGNMTSSIPYVVPKASELLDMIGKNFYDSLYVKRLPLHKIIVSSVLRSDEDVTKLMGENVNANRESCHGYGTTFDICYRRYYAVPPAGQKGYEVVTDDTLKFVLSEVLRDLRADSLCYVKYELKQSCFHITVR